MSNFKMIIEKQIEKLNDWLKQGYIYEDAEGSGFYVNIKERIGGHEFLSIPDKFRGNFIPIEFDNDCNIGVCSGNAFTKRKISGKRATHICKLYRLKSMHLYDYRFHDNSLMSAISFASFHHKYQRRKADDSAYISHLIEVTRLIEKVGGYNDLDILKSAMLHDIVEDGHVYIESINFLFGKRVKDIVSELTSTITSSTLDKRIDLIEKLKVASNEGKLIKLADLSSNVVLIPNWSKERINEYIDWCQVVGNICKSASPRLYKHFIKHCTVILHKQKK